MLNIRRFAPGDGSSVKTLINNIMTAEFKESGSAYPTQDIENLPDSYKGLGEAFFVAEKDGKIVGTVAIKKEDDRIALLRRLFLDSSCRGQNLGIKLIERALKFSEEVGYDEVVFKTTSQMEGAIRTCRKCGFAQRAKIALGGVELLKFSLHIKNLQKAGK